VYESDYLARPTEEALMSRYLVVANQTIGGNELIDEIRRRIASGPSSFYVVVPTMPVAGHGMETLGSEGSSLMIDTSELDSALHHRAEAATGSRLSELTNRIRAAGGEAEGGVGPTDPVKAIDEVIADGGFDEIIISTLPEGVSRWLRMDVPNRVKRKFKIPVTTVTAK
jgi:hypothetical protein